MCSRIINEEKILFENGPPVRLRIVLEIVF